MIINNIFFSLQGEGVEVGAPTIFIRTAGCNLRCTYCDTTQAYRKGKRMTLQQIVTKVERFPCKNVCITGGEPLLQPNLPQLIQKLTKKRYIITIETNGSKSIKKYSDKKSVRISLDIKCPSSGMMEQMDFTNLSLLTKKDQLKCIIQNKKDYDYAKKIVMTMHPSCAVFFQPVWGTSMKQLSSWILRDGLPVRFGTQLHKIIWDANTRK